jgi:hypothetical protein
MGLYDFQLLFCFVLFCFTFPSCSYLLGLDDEQEL